MNYGNALVCVQREDATDAIAAARPSGVELLRGPAWDYLGLNPVN